MCDFEKPCQQWCKFHPGQEIKVAEEQEVETILIGTRGQISYHCLILDKETKERVGCFLVDLEDHRRGPYLLPFDFPKGIVCGETYPCKMK